MARKITFGKLINSFAKDIPRLQNTEFAAEIVATTINKVWLFQDFRETLAKLPPFYLVGGMQDYGKPIYTIPVDFLALRQASLKSLSDGNNSIGATSTSELKVVTRQAPIVRYGTPDVISFEPSEKVFRIFPILGPQTASNLWIVEGVYKKLPQSNLFDGSTVYGTPILSSDITSDNFNRVLLPIDDRHYDVLKDVAGLLARKASAGLTTEQMQIEQYIDAKLVRIANEEGLDIGSHPISPESGLQDQSGPYPVVFW